MGDVSDEVPEVGGGSVPEGGKGSWRQRRGSRADPARRAGRNDGSVVHCSTRCLALLDNWRGGSERWQGQKRPSKLGGCQVRAETSEEGSDVPGAKHFRIEVRIP